MLLLFYVNYNYRQVEKELTGERKQQLQQFIERFKLPTTDLETLDLALTHPTYAYEQGLSQHNQRLEYLGDAVLGLVIATYLFNQFPHLPEGDMTRMRAAIVCEASLVKVARQIDLGKLLLLGQGEELSGGRERRSNLADALEAIIGGLYLKDFKSTQDFVLQLFAPLLKMLNNTGIIDSKSALQEFIQQKGDNVNYKILEEQGPPHARHYKAGVFLQNRLLATGEGSSKKESEQDAARAALALLKIQD